MRSYSLTPMKLKISILFCLLLIPTWGWAAKNPQQATKVSISLVDGMAVAPNGDIYIARREHNVISLIDKQGRLKTVVGTGASGFSGDGGPASESATPVALPVWPSIQAGQSLYRGPGQSSST